MVSIMSGALVYDECKVSDQDTKLRIFFIAVHWH